MTPIVCCWMKMKMITLISFSKINIYNCGRDNYIICFGSVSVVRVTTFSSQTCRARLCLPAAADFSVLKPSTPTVCQEEVKLIYYLPASLDLTVSQKAMMPTKYLFRKRQVLICCSWYLNHLTISLHDFNDHFSGINHYIVLSLKSLHLLVPNLFHILHFWLP